MIDKILTTLSELVSLTCQIESTKDISEKESLLSLISLKLEFVHQIVNKKSYDLLEIHTNNQVAETLRISIKENYIEIIPIEPLPHKIIVNGTTKKTTYKYDKGRVYTGWYNSLAKGIPKNFNKYPSALIEFNFYKSYDYRICDYDNIDTKFLIDTLVSFLIVDDSPQHVNVHYNYNDESNDNYLIIKIHSLP